jgi:hypothetical protein
MPKLSDFRQPKQIDMSHREVQTQLAAWQRPTRYERMRDRVVD